MRVRSDSSSPVLTPFFVSFVLVSYPPIPFPSPASSIPKRLLFLGKFVCAIDRGRLVDVSGLVLEPGDRGHDEDEEARGEG